MPVAPFIGLVGQPPMQDLLRCAKHLFVAAMVAWVHPGLPPIGKSEDRGGVRVWSREVFKGSKSKAPPLTRGCPAVHWQIDDVLPPQDLLLCAQHLFVAAMVAGFTRAERGGSIAGAGHAGHPIWTNIQLLALNNRGPSL